ncbi:ATP synthase subunit delta, mitochondrial-like [Argonauta hians]
MALTRSILRLGSAVRAAANTNRLGFYTVSPVCQQQQTRNYADMAFTFASPGDIFYNNSKVNQVDVPSLSGSFGILPDHVPTIGVLKPGVVTVFEDDGAKKFFVSSGSITINDDSSVQILAEEAHPLDSLDVGAIREGLAKAQQDVGSAATESAKAEAQIALECYEALQKAVE